MAAPPPSVLSHGIPLILGDSQDAVLSEASGTASAVVLLYARGRGGTNGQASTIPKGAQLPVRGSQVERILLSSGSVAYVVGQTEVPSLPGGATVPVSVPNPLPVQVTNPPTNPAPIGVLFTGGPPPFSGKWTGTALSVAAGEVALGVYGGNVVLGTATAAGQSFPFVLAVQTGESPGQTNCNIAGGWLSQA